MKESDGGSDGDDEVDPLDAFMRGNDAAASEAIREAAEEEAAAARAERERAAEAAAARAAAAAAAEAAAEAEAEAKSGDAAATSAAAAGKAGGGGGEGEDTTMTEAVHPAAPAAAATTKPPPLPAARRSRRDRALSSSSSSDGEDGDGADDGGDDDDNATVRLKKAEDEAEEDDVTWARNVALGLTKTSKGGGDKLAAAALLHAEAAARAQPFRRAFYTETPELARMPDEEVKKLRLQLDGVRVRGKAPPKPISRWTQAGLAPRLLDALRLRGCERPTPIQAQALPAIMAGRDVLGVAKTGSGKTLAYLLPALRHVKDQRPLASGDGPIALVLAPTRELVAQIGKEAKRFGKAVGVSAVSAYGGAALGTQVSDLKRGAEIVAASPGRLIDVLAMGGGRITNLRRVTFLCLDEADRMFDLGFEPQIARIAGLVRPDRQSVLFSATFPRAVEALARSLLRHEPLEVVVGGRAVVNADIEQRVELRPKRAPRGEASASSSSAAAAASSHPSPERFLRLLQLLGEQPEGEKALVFVNSQDEADALFRALRGRGHPCLSLHGGMDQEDRAGALADFKGGVVPLMVATSVAARGLDVRDLSLVVNFEPPTHLEDYVHRVGRTGRAGRKGTAVTFISPDPADGEAKFAGDLCRALRDAGRGVPGDLASLAEAHRAAVAAGEARDRGSGFGGHGFKFDAAEEANSVKAARAAAAAKIRDAGEEEDEDGEEEGGRGEGDESNKSSKKKIASAVEEAGRAARAGADGRTAARDGRAGTEVDEGDDDVVAVGGERDRLRAREAAAAAAASSASAAAAASLPSFPPPPSGAPQGDVSLESAIAAAAARVAAVNAASAGAAPAPAPAALAAAVAAPASSAVPAPAVAAPAPAAPAAAVAKKPAAAPPSAAAAAAIRAAKAAAARIAGKKAVAAVRERVVVAAAPALAASAPAASAPAVAAAPAVPAAPITTQPPRPASHVNPLSSVPLSRPPPQQAAQASALVAAAQAAALRFGGGAGGAGAVGGMGGGANAAAAAAAAAAVAAAAARVAGRGGAAGAGGFLPPPPPLPPGTALPPPPPPSGDEDPAVDDDGSSLTRHRQFFQSELEVNDFLQQARWKVTHKSTTAAIEDATGAAVIMKGVFYPAGAEIPPGERKMYLLIQARTPAAVRAAKAACKRIIEEATEKAMRRDGGAGPVGGKYNVF